MGVEIFWINLNTLPTLLARVFPILCALRVTLSYNLASDRKFKFFFRSKSLALRKETQKNFNHGSPCNLSWCCRCDSCSGYKGKLIKKCTYSADTLHNVTSQVHNVTAQVESILLKGKKKQHSRSRRDLNNVKKGLSQWLGRKIQRWYF